MPRIDPYAILAERIRQGCYPDGATLPSERSLAEELGVHRTTVQRSIARLTAEGLLDRQRGCRPVVRQATRVAKSTQVTAILTRSSSPSLSTPPGALIYGAQSVLRPENHRLLFMSTFARDRAARQQTEHEDLASLVADPVNGLIIVPQDPEGSAPYIQRLMQNGTTVVAADRRIEGIETDYVGVDNTAGINAAIDYLLAVGHRRIGFVDCTGDRYGPADIRRQAYLHATRRAGVRDPASQVLDIADAGDEASTDAAVQRYFDVPEPPTALACVDDEAAWHTARSLARLGLRVPDDVSIVGFDDDRRHIDLGVAELTTVRQPFFDMGREAASLLLSRLRHPDASIRSVLLLPSLVERTSVRAMNTGRPTVSHGRDTVKERPQ